MAMLPGKCCSWAGPSCTREKQGVIWGIRENTHTGGSAMKQGACLGGLQPSPIRPVGRTIAAEPSPYLPPPGGQSRKGRTVRAERCHQASPEPHSTQAWTPGKQDSLLGRVRNPPGNSGADVGDPSEERAGLGRTSSLLPHHDREGAKIPGRLQPWDAGQAGASVTQAGHCQQKVNPSPTTSRSQEGRGSSRGCRAPASGSSAPRAI